MSVYTSLERAQIECFIKAYDCGQLVAFDGIADGITNSNFYLDTDRDRYVLTLYEQLEPERLQPILRLQQHLHLQDIPCAGVIADRDGNLNNRLADHDAVIYQRLPGSIEYNISNALCQQVGQNLARFHDSAAGYSFSLPNSRGAAWMFEVSDKMLPLLDADRQQVLRDELDYLGRFSSLSLPSGAIHADLFPDNALVMDGRLSAIIDFDYACRDVYLFDLAIAINAWCSHADGQLDRFRMRDLLAAYASIRPLTQQENLAIPMMLRASALRFWLSRLYDKLFPTEGEMTFHKDPDEFLRILLARRQRLSGMQR